VIKAAGGVSTGEHALEMLRAGARAVELYSAFIYRGWDVAGKINRELLTHLAKNAEPRVAVDSGTALNA